VLGTPVSAIPEFLNQFDIRLIFQGTDWIDKKEKLEQVVDRSDQFHFDPRACRNFVAENYSWEKMAIAFEKEAMELIK